jgi:large subunit ribosomal protein L33
MARKSNRIIVFMSCGKCKRQNYITQKNKVNMQVKKLGKLGLKKYCPQCKEVTLHKETRVKKGKSRKTGA